MLGLDMNRRAEEDKRSREERFVSSEQRDFDRAKKQIQSLNKRLATIVSTVNMEFKGEAKAINMLGKVHSLISIDHS